MSCQVVGEMMHKRLDGVLDDAQVAEMGKHLECCVECHKRWDLFLLVSSRLENSPRLAPSPDFTSGVLARLDCISTPGGR